MSIAWRDHFEHLAGASMLSTIWNDAWNDPLGIGAAALFVLCVAFAAGALPGRNAARQQPLTALHYE